MPEMEPSGHRSVAHLRTTALPPVIFLAKGHSDDDTHRIAKDGEEPSRSVDEDGRVNSWRVRDCYAYDSSGYVFLCPPVRGRPLWKVRRLMMRTHCAFPIDKSQLRAPAG